MQFDVVMPVYKRPEVLDVCLFGLERQRHHIGKIIITENLGAGDPVAEGLADKYGAEYYVCDHGETFSKSATVNNGLEHVESELVFFCDQDSWFPPEYLDKMLDLHEEWQNLLIFSDAYRVDAINALNFRRRIPGDDARWSSPINVRPIWDMNYVDGNCTCRSEYAKMTKWEQGYKAYGGELRAFGHRIATMCRVVPCIFDYIWYFHIEHDKDDPAYHFDAEDTRVNIDSDRLKGKLVAKKVNPES